MQDFLETLLYIVIGLWILRLIAKWAFPYVLKYFLRSMGKKAQKGFERQNPETKTKKQTNSKFNSRSKEDKEKVGEYIDFEEID